VCRLEKGRGSGRGSWNVLWCWRLRDDPVIGRVPSKKCHWVIAGKLDLSTIRLHQSSLCPSFSRSDTPSPLSSLPSMSPSPYRYTDCNKHLRTHAQKYDAPHTRHYSQHPHTLTALPSTHLHMWTSHIRQLSACTHPCTPALNSLTHHCPPCTPFHPSSPLPSLLSLVLPLTLLHLLIPSIY